MKQKYMSLAELQECCKNANVKSRKDYHNLYKLFVNENGHVAPSSPNSTYDTNGWDSWSQLTNNKKLENSAYMSLEELQVFCKNANVKSVSDYKKLYQTFISTDSKVAPSQPSRFYKQYNWSSWEQLTGNKNKKTTNFMTFGELQEFCNTIKIESQEHYLKIYKNFITPDGRVAPHYPNKIYKNSGWVCWEQIIDSKIFMSIDELRVFCKNSDIKSSDDYYKLYKTFVTPENKKAPCKPNIIYKSNGWISWSDLTGVNPIQYMTLDELIQCCSDCGVNSRADYYSKFKQMRSKNGDCAPAKPHVIYKLSKWKGWWQLTGNKSSQCPNFMSFDELQTICKKICLYSQTDYNNIYKTLKSTDGKTAPAKPNKIYRNVTNIWDKLLFKKTNW